MTLLRAPCGPHFEHEVHGEIEEMKVIVESVQLLTASLEHILQKTTALFAEYGEVNHKLKAIRVHYNTRCLETDNKLLSPPSHVSTHRPSSSAFMTIDLSLNTLQLIASQQLQMLGDVSTSFSVFSNSIEAELQQSINSFQRFSNITAEYESHVLAYLHKSDVDCTGHAKNGVIKPGAKRTRPSSQSFFTSNKTASKAIQAPIVGVSDNDIIHQMRSLERARRQVASDVRLRFPLALTEDCESVYKAICCSLQAMKGSFSVDLLETESAIEDIRLKNIGKLHEFQICGADNEKEILKSETTFQDRERSSLVREAHPAADILDTTQLALESPHTPNVIKQVCG
jgi:hypothetical protein